MTRLRKILMDLCDELEQLNPNLPKVNVVPDLSSTIDTTKYLVYPIVNISKEAYAGGHGGPKTGVYLVEFADKTFRTYQENLEGNLVNRGKNFWDRSDVIIISGKTKEEIKEKVCDKVTGNGGLDFDIQSYVIPK